MLRFVLVMITLFTSLLSWSQPNLRGTITVRKPKNVTPLIAGKADGPITPSELSLKTGIYVTQDSVQIISFELNFAKGGTMVTQQVNGNQMPDRMCKEFFKLPAKSQITINNILAQDQYGRKFTLTPMRFEIVPELNDTKVKVEEVKNTTKWGNRGRELGMYQLKLSHIPIQKTYIKLGEDSTAFYVYSPGEPVVLNQVLIGNYNRTNLYHGIYSTKGDSIFIDFNSAYCDFDYRGIMQPGGLILAPYSHEGKKINLTTGEQRFVVLPFSKN